ncbi:MAG: glutamate--tRNA ligase [Balneolaceae bacterium]|nr:glutamate--tRNA ligase [Balneolaceae bacterium]MDR9446796.1 glutamate--tRNA ligase [Balneolaceae bacterium]
MSTPVRVRFAPSPTGFLHIGGLRTALYNYLFAKHHGGSLILRIEDTDQARFIEGAEEDILRSLKWCGIDIDESPIHGGEAGPYRQSERKQRYNDAAKQLLEADAAYYAFDTTEEIETMRERLKASGNPSPSYDSITRQSMKNSLTLPSDEVQKRLEAGDPYVIRLKVPRRESVQFTDIIRGVVTFETKGMDDQVLMKSDGMPTYHLANVVDDHDMGITHVIRGEEWLSSAPKHMLLYQYFGWEPPTMAHLPLIMSPSGGKLSKRKAEQEGIPVNTRDYIDGHYEPEALVNFLAYLGWSPGDDSEIHSMDELERLFSLEKVSKAGAVFNFKKLMWYNEHYLRHQTDESLVQRLLELPAADALPGVTAERLHALLPLLKERITRLDEFFEMGAFFFEDPQDYDEKGLKKAGETAPPMIEALMESLRAHPKDELSAEEYKTWLHDTAEAQGVGMGKVMLPTRLAISGAGFGPDLTPSLALLGKDVVIRRLQTALKHWSS